MSNPFVSSGFRLVELQRRRREGFRIGVFAVLATSFVFLLGLLIQGCNSRQTTLDSSNNSAAGAVPAATNALRIVQQAPTGNLQTPPRVSATPASSASQSAAANSPVQAPPVAQESKVASPPSTENVYVVKSGDSLSKIARAHNTTAKALKAENALKSDRLLVGTKLKLPQANPPTAPTTQA